MKLKATKEHKRRARIILRRVQEVQTRIEQEPYREMQLIVKILVEEMRELLRDVELSNLEAWGKL